MRRCCILTPRTEDKRSRMSSSSSNKFTNRSTAHTVCLSVVFRGSQSMSSGRTVSPSWHIRSPGFCSGWPDGLKLYPGQSPGSRCYYRQPQAFVENVFVFVVPVQLAHWMYYDYALCKFTFYFTYLHHQLVSKCQRLSCRRRQCNRTVSDVTILWAWSGEAAARSRRPIGGWAPRADENIFFSQKLNFRGWSGHICLVCHH